MARGDAILSENELQRFHGQIQEAGKLGFTGPEASGGRTGEGKKAFPVKLLDGAGVIFVPADG